MTVLKVMQVVDGKLLCSRKDGQLERLNHAVKSLHPACNLLPQAGLRAALETAGGTPKSAWHNLPALLASSAVPGILEQWRKSH